MSNLKGNLNLAVGGGVIRNHVGKVLRAYYGFYGSCSSLEAEIRAPCTSLKLCNQFGYAQIWDEIDSLSTLQRIEKGTDGPRQVHHLEEIHHWGSR